MLPMSVKAALLTFHLKAACRSLATLADPREGGGNVTAALRCHGGRGVLSQAERGDDNGAESEP